MKEFIAIDGEGITLPSGKHIYNMIAASTGEILLDDSGLGLRTKEIFKWLLDLSANHPNATFVSFYFSYDVNKLLRNIPKDGVRQLAKSGFVKLFDPVKKHYCHKVDYAPVKFFKLQFGYYVNNELSNGPRYVATESITIWDVWGFFQSNFLNGMKSFNVGTEEEHSIIKSMKHARADFDSINIEEVIAYNALECKMLVEAMHKLNNALETCDLKLTSWHGAGAVAMAMMRKYGVTKHIKRPTGIFELPVLHAYFGGRIQAIRLGEFERAYGHDINSAYPYSATFLPSLKGMGQQVVEWDEKWFEDFEVIDGQPNHYIVWHVKWDLPPETLITPFPFRMEDGSIEYPLKGEGYYWMWEVYAALEHYPVYIDVLEGYHFVVKSHEKPFEFIPDVYEERARFKREKNHAEKALKLGLNSLYGKTAQGKGFMGVVPKSQCYIWAGLITSHTRSTMFRLGMSNPEAVISFCTDGLYATQQLTEEKSSLGGWEVSKYVKYFNIKSGFYRGREICKGKTLRRVRGFRLNEINFSDLKRVWNELGIAGSIEVPGRRFVGMKGAGKELKNWGEWVEYSKELSMFPSHGYPKCIQDEPPVYVIYGGYQDGVSAMYKPEMFDEVDAGNSENKEQ